MADERKGWYVLRVISGKEAKVKETLDAAIKNTPLGEHVIQVLIPVEKVYTTRNGKKVLKDRTLYSGYVFVEAYLHPIKKEVNENGSKKTIVEYKLSGEAMYELKNTTNVIDFLRGRAKGSEPEALRESEVKRMLGAADEINETVEESGEVYLVGEPVKVIFGPFSGFSGVVTEVNNDKRKLKVEVKIFGRPTDLELENSQVERE